MAAVNGPAIAPDAAEKLCLLKKRLVNGESDPFRDIVESYSHRVDLYGRCQLFPADDCAVHRISCYALTGFFISLFETAAELSGAALSRYDLFHGHVFFNRTEQILGVLFHAKEYPAFEEDIFPYELGFCQSGSNLFLNGGCEMERRSVLWVFGEEGMGLVESSDRLPFGTVYEGEFGEAIADLFYFESRFQWGRRRLNVGLHIAVYECGG